MPGLHPPPDRLASLVHETGVSRCSMCLGKGGANQSTRRAAPAKCSLCMGRCVRPRSRWTSQLENCWTETMASSGVRDWTHRFIAHRTVRCDCVELEMQKVLGCREAHESAPSSSSFCILVSASNTRGKSLSLSDVRDWRSRESKCCW